MNVAGTIGYSDRENPRTYGRAWTNREFYRHVNEHLKEHGYRALFTQAQIERMEAATGDAISVVSEVVGGAFGVDGMTCYQIAQGEAPRVLAALRALALTGPPAAEAK